MFDSIYSATVTPLQFLTMAGAALLSGFIFSWIMSFSVRSSRRFFSVSTILPFVVGAVITFVNGNIGAGVAIGGTFGLIRFRSAQGTADEIATLLIAMGAGIAFGMGYVFYGIMIMLVLGAAFVLFSNLPLFEHKSQQAEKLLLITIPEALEYTGAFDEIFARYLKKWEKNGVKTTGMGSMFRLSYKIVFRTEDEEKAFIDAIRTRNGNLEVAILPYVELQQQL